MSKNKHKASYKLDNRTAPKEFKLWSAGENPTDYGMHLWTENSAKVVFDQYNQRGNLLGLDVEHTGSSDSEMKDDPTRPTAGYCSLEIRKGEPWIIFDWSDYAVEQIESGQRRYLSPEYYTDPDTKEIIGLERVSLVHEPGTWGIKLLCSKNKTTNGINIARTKNMEDSDLKMIGVVLLALKMAAEKVTDESAKGLMVQAMEALKNGLGDMVQPAMDAASSESEQEVEVAAEVEAPKPEDKKEEVKTEMAPEDKKEVASLKAQVANLASKLEGLMIGIQAGKLGVASIKTKVTPIETHGLSLDELNRCKENKMDPAKYAASKARMVSKK